ncbi:MAG TPA: helix-turn-helix transcriptional regulator [Microbacteriaceae bacterium]|nr:helix-turn-helix transcriptional regulator [Microbacteriaceae bacterium]
MGHARAEDLRRALDGVLDLAATTAPQCDDAWGLALGAFIASWRLEHDEATRLSRAAAARLSARPADDPEAAVLVYSMLGLAAAGTGIRGRWTDTAPGTSPTGDPLADAVALLVMLEPGSDAATFARYALAEASLACARVALADRALGEPMAFSGDLAGHPFETVMVVLASRIALFAGRIDEARTLLARIGDGLGPRLRMLADATRSLVEGNASDPGTVRAIAAEIERSDRADEDRIGFGIALLCAYGLIAQGEVRRAAALAAGPGWERTMIIDRAIVCELLVNAASLDDDLAAAEAWLAHAEEYADGPIADSTVDRIRSRVGLLADDPVAALCAAEEAIRRATDEGRTIEAAEGEILAARARIAAGRAGEAARRLEQAVAAARPGGHEAIRRSARRALHSVGRRLRPTSGSGSSELSAREREVLELLLRGLENAQIAGRLHISPHTVRIHVSRILAAFGVHSRLALVAGMLAESPPAGPASDAAVDLTARQRMVVAEAATGAGNVEIAARLGIAVRTVEKHLTDAMRRTGTTTRVGLLVRVAAEGRGARSE